MTLKELEKVLYFESYVVTDPGETTLQVRELTSSRVSEAHYPGSLSFSPSSSRNPHPYNELYRR